MSLRIRKEGLWVTFWQRCASLPSERVKLVIQFGAVCPLFQGRRRWAGRSTPRPRYFHLRIEVLQATGISEEAHGPIPSANKRFSKKETVTLIPFLRGGDGNDLPRSLCLTARQTIESGCFRLVPRHSGIYRERH